MTKIFENNSFFLGCNYWASHAGIDMWKNWDEDVVKRDLKLLSEKGIKVLRIFPLWSDFQPIRLHLDYKVLPKEMRLGEKPFEHTPEGVAGVDSVMIERFQTFLDIGKENGIQFIVGLITGWMSGRLYMPEALLNFNPITDPRSIKWQIKFVKYMVNRFKDHSAISAWDLGNECNCMGEVTNSEEAYVWMSVITDAIKSCDNTRPVVSGMHGMSTNKCWNFRDQGEVNDIVCTHPYTIYTPYCDSDPLNEMKTILHSTAQTLYYRGLAQKSAFIEEVGALGPWVASEEVAADFYKTVLFSGWAHNCLGSMWWCAFDQGHLVNTPYDWSGIERYLGFFRKDMSEKPVLKSIADFTKVQEKTGQLSDRIVDAVCIIANIPDPWRAAFGTFMIAKKAQLDVEYCFVDDKTPDANAYILPVLKGSVAVYKHQLDAILEKVENGATLYMSVDDVLLCEPIDYMAGIQIQYRNGMTAPVYTEVDGERIPLQGRYRVTYKELDGKVLLRDEDGMPVLTEKSYGKGTIYFLAYPIEDYAASQPGSCSGEKAIGYEKIYSLMQKLRNSNKRIFCNNPCVGLTEHPENSCIKAVLVNYRPEKQTAKITADGLKIKEIIGNVTVSGDEFTIEANDGAVIIFEE